MGRKFCHSTKCLILYHFVLCTWCCFTNHFRRLYIYIYIYSFYILSESDSFLKEGVDKLVATLANFHFPPFKSPYLSQGHNIYNITVWYIFVYEYLKLLWNYGKIYITQIYIKLRKANTWMLAWNLKTYIPILMIIIRM